MHNQGVTLSSVYLIIILSVHNNDVHHKIVQYRLSEYITTCAQKRRALKDSAQ